ncbi:hypothetical protein ACIQ6R_13030 [Streptomyces sp. NPDC096048]|uniref:hypothetical protein n=1 Tax=Streptomyces sp. NPDC096048 TaxID=3366072 RepID=UPI0038282EB6
MATEITFRPGIDGIMTALAVAEQVAATAPAVPTSVQVNDGHFDYVPGTFERPMGVLFYFHRNAENVQAFAEAFALDVQNRDHDGTTTYVYAEGALNGVPFRAWTLQDVETPAASEESSAVAA